MVIITGKTRFVVQILDDENPEWKQVAHGRSSYNRLSWATKRACKLATANTKADFRVSDQQGNEIWLAERQLALQIEPHTVY